MNPVRKSYLSFIVLCFFLALIGCQSVPITSPIATEPGYLLPLSAAHDGKYIYMGHNKPVSKLVNVHITNLQNQEVTRFGHFQVFLNDPFHWRLNPVWDGTQFRQANQFVNKGIYSIEASASNALVVKIGIIHVYHLYGRHPEKLSASSSVKLSRSLGFKVASLPTFQTFLEGSAKIYFEALTGASADDVNIEKAPSKPVFIRDLIVVYRNSSQNIPTVEITDTTQLTKEKIRFLQK